MLKRLKLMGVTALMAMVAIISFGGSASAALVAPTIPSSDTIFQSMIDNFGTAGTVAIAIIGGAVALGVVVILGMWGWRLAKKWLNAAK